MKVLINVTISITFIFVVDIHFSVYTIIYTTIQFALKIYNKEGAQFCLRANIVYYLHKFIMENKYTKSKYR